MRVDVYCESCLTRIPLPPPESSPSGEATCQAGHPGISFQHSEGVRSGERVDRCSRCTASAFYRQLDFDQRVGCLVLLAGALAGLAVSRFFGGIWFVPTLLLFAGADFIMARRIGSVVICYRCDTEYRDVPDVQKYRAYDPHIAERDAELKTVRRMNP